MSKTIRHRHCHSLNPDVELGRIPWSTHDFHEIIFVMSGTYVAETATGRQAVEANQGVLYPAGCRHRGHAPMDGSSSLMNLAWWGGEDPRQFQFTDASGYIRLALHWLHDLPQDRSGGIQQNALTVAIIEQVKRGVAQPESFDDPIQETRRFLHTTCHMAIDMALLSKRTGLAASTVNRLFRERYGIAPMSFLQQVRAKRAAAMIAACHDDLPTIARRVGLQSGRHVSRLLKKHIGRTARQLRKGDW